MVLRDLTSASCAGGSSSAARAPLSSLAARLAERAGAPPPQNVPPAPPTADDRINDLIHGRYRVPEPHPAVQGHPSPMLMAQRDAMYRHRQYTPLMPPLPEPEPNSVTAQFEAAYAAARNTTGPPPTPPAFRTPLPTPVVGPVPFRGIPRMFPIIPLQPHGPVRRAVEVQQESRAPSNTADAGPSSSDAGTASRTNPQTREGTLELYDEMYNDLMRRLQSIGIRSPNTETLNTIAESQSSPGEDFTGLDEFQATAEPDDDNENQSTLDSYVNDFAAAVGTTAENESTYRFEDNNPFNGVAAAEALAEGERLRAEGQLTQALQAFEAALNRPIADPHPPLEEGDIRRAWYLLGITLAECDDDERAIQALLRVSANLGVEDLISTSTNESLGITAAAALALAVSYVNELDIPQATMQLWRWLRFRGVLMGESAEIPTASRNNEDMSAVIRALGDVAMTNPEDIGEVQLALGVAHNAVRDYDSAAIALRRAVAGREDDARLWNRLGATLANGGRSDEALRAYRRAVDLCPLYLRAWVNVGTAYANNNDFGRAARYYLRALDMATDAEDMAHVWSYLRSSLLSLDRMDLVEYCETSNLEAMRKHFSF